MAVTPPPTPSPFVPRVTTDVDVSGTWTDVDSFTATTFSRRLNEAGEARGKVPVAASGDVALIVLNRRTRVSIDATPQFAGRLKPTRREVITQDGAARWVEVSAPGLLSELGDATVLPPFGPDVTPSTSQRVFNWACPEVDDSISPWTDWTDVAAVTGIDGRPWGNPDPFSRRIWAASGDKVYARRKATVVAGKVYPFFTASSGWHRQWVGGVTPLEGEKSPMPSDEFARRSVPRFTASGDVVFALEAERLDAYTTPWLNATLYALSDAVTGELSTATWVSHTGLIPSTMTHDAWLVSTTPVGPTPGRIVRALIEEAQALGLLAGWSLSCTDTHDSNGVAWDRVTEVVLSVGDTVLAALERMASTELDFAAAHDGTRVLHLYRWGEQGNHHSAPPSPPILSGARFGVSPGRSGNIVELAHEFQDAPPTRLHVVWERGSFVTGTGTVMRSVGVPAKSREGAQAIADRIIDGGDSDAVSQTVTVALQPRNGDDRPFVDFDVGDAVSCPDETGTFRTYRVVAITVTTTSTANPRYLLELATPLAERSSRAQRWLTQLDPGGLNGMSPASSTPTDLGSGIDAGVLSEIRTVAFNQNGPMAVDESDPWVASQRVRCYRFTSALATPGTTDATIEVRRNGVAVHVITHPATYTQHDGFMGSIYLAKGDVLTVAVTTAAVGAAGLVVEPFATEAI